MAGKVLIIGNGGREHAIAWKLSKSERVQEIFVSPGSRGIENVSKTKNVLLDLKNFEVVAKWCRNNDINLVVVGPEVPLADGIVDALESTGVKCFGPNKNAAQIEASKEWAKAFMNRNDIPTARWQSFTDATAAKNFINTARFAALVVKASGLAAGKGVVVAADRKAACDAVDEMLTDQKFGSAGETVIVEELLTGEEVSVLGFCDGTTVKAMLPAQDHKRIGDGDRGLMTGGMGAYCPCPLLTDTDLSTVQTDVLERTVRGFRKENIKFVGVLYAGLMLTDDGPKVLEFNCRFGDPETEVILPLLQSDLYEIMMACCTDGLLQQSIRWKENLFAVGVVMASRGYPTTSSEGQTISGINKVENLPNHMVFHCGTGRNDDDDDDEWITNGGRVLIVVAIGQRLAAVAAHARLACGFVSFDGAQYRRDVAHKGVSRSILATGGGLTYKDSGVDITAGDNLVDRIKPLARSTNRRGTMGSLGGFGGLFDVQAAGYVDPILVSGTDGVGTKLKIAQVTGIHSTIGIDLVAMCVNDVLAHGAEPLFFLDYFACGSLDVAVAKDVVTGIAEGCKLAGCSLIGGETAEMPDMYPPGEYDLAGFAVGAVERNKILQQSKNSIVSGDVVIGLPSSGVHSNGFSLVRRVMKIAGVDYSHAAPFSATNKTFGEELLTPTRIYVEAVLPLVKSDKLKAFAHITGGGLTENIPRILNHELCVRLDAKLWTVPSVFGWIATCGGVNETEMLRTFNCGLGAVLIVAQNLKDEALRMVEPYGGRSVGNVCPRPSSGPYVEVVNFAAAMEGIMRPHVAAHVALNATPKKKVGVLISGGGTNLQALIDATLDPSERSGAEIVLVISNRADVEGLKRAERVGIPTKVFNHRLYTNRTDFDMVVHAELLRAGVEIVCLAGFMRILSGEFTKLWRGRLLNVHPALLPSFKGTHAQRQALDAGVLVTGCSVHFVEEDVDAGAIIAQEVVAVEANDTEDTLTERIKSMEHKAYPKALRLLATGKIRLTDDNKLVWL